MRSFPVGRYIVFYMPLDDGVVVIRVLHGSRDIDAIFRVRRKAATPRPLPGFLTNSD